MSIMIDEAAIRRLATEPGGGIALAVEETAQAFVEDAQRTLSIDVVYTGYFSSQVEGVFRRFPRSAPNPPPGPPRRRTGDLQRSIRWTRDPAIDPAAVYVISDAATSSHRHDNPDYSALLRSQGYKFLSFELPETFH